MAGLVTVMGLTGCVPFACPAIGWSNGLTVLLDGDTTAVDQVQVCTEDGCAPADDVDPSGPLGSISVTDQDGDTWIFTVGMTSLERVTVRTLSADGAVLSDTEVAPE